MLVCRVAWAALSDCQKHAGSKNLVWLVLAWSLVTQSPVHKLYGCADVSFWGKGLIPSFSSLPGKGLCGQLGYTAEQRGPAEYTTQLGL